MNDLTDTLCVFFVSAVLAAGAVVCGAILHEVFVMPHLAGV